MEKTQGVKFTIRKEKANKKENEWGLAENQYYFIQFWFDLQDSKLKKLFLVSLGSEMVHLDWAQCAFEFPSEEHTSTINS